MPSKSVSRTKDHGAAGRYIYIAAPWGPKGGGMFKVADYLIQAQAASRSTGTAELRYLDTRGGGSAIYSFLVLAAALSKLVSGRISGKLRGVHVNMAERLSLFRKGVVVVACQALGLPVVLHLHAAQLHHFYHALPRPLQSLTRWLFSLPSHCIVLGNTAKRFVTEELQVSHDRVEIVYNGVPEPTVIRRKRTAGSVQRLLFLGNLSERKGVSDLLQALALPCLDTSRLEVILAGDGDLQAYQEKARMLHVDGFVHFEGWADQRKVSCLLAYADVLVLPSYDEGLPLVILEAMANRVAIVCSPVGEIPSVLTDGINVCFVQPGDVKGIASTLQRVLHQPELMESLGRNGRALYEERFSLTRFFLSVARIHRRCFGIAGEPLDAIALTENDGVDFH